LAESNGFNGRGIQVGEKAAKRGTVFTFESNEAGSGINTVKYC
jgi:hypothetical protein